LKSEAPFEASDDIYLSFVYLHEQVILMHGLAMHRWLFLPLSHAL